MAASGSANDRDARATLYAQGVMEAERKAREEKTARLRKARLAHEAINPPAPSGNRQCRKRQSGPPNQAAEKLEKISFSFFGCAGGTRRGRADRAVDLHDKFVSHRMTQRSPVMTEHVSRKEEQRGTRNVLGWGVVIAAVIFVALLAFFVFIPLSGGSWQTSPVKRTPEQNQGGNAPAETSPAAGVKKSPQENTEMPGQQ